MKAGTPSPMPTPSATFVDSSNPELVEVGVDLGGSWRRVVGESILAEKTDVDSSSQGKQSRQCAVVYGLDIIVACLWREGPKRVSRNDYAGKKYE